MIRIGEHKKTATVLASVAAIVGSMFFAFSTGDDVKAGLVMVSRPIEDGNRGRRTVKPEEADSPDKSKSTNRLSGRVLIDGDAPLTEGSVIAYDVTKPVPTRFVARIQKNGGYFIDGLPNCRLLLTVNIYSDSEPTTRGRIGKGRGKNAEVQRPPQTISSMKSTKPARMEEPFTEAQNQMAEFIMDHYGGDRNKLFQKIEEYYRGPAPAHRVIAAVAGPDNAFDFNLDLKMQLDIR